MPAQTSSSTTAYYVDGDTAPPLVRTLRDADDAIIDLTNATVLVIMPLGNGNGLYVKDTQSYRSSSLFSEWYMHTTSSKLASKEEYDRAE